MLTMDPRHMDAQPFFAECLLSNQDIVGPSRCATVNGIPPFGWPDPALGEPTIATIRCL